MYYEINVSKLEKEAYYSEKKAYKHLFATAPRSCTSRDELKRTLQEIVDKFPDPEYHISISYNPEQMSGISVNEILEKFSVLDDEPNKLVEMFDIAKVKKQISDCKETECVILCNNWSINQPKYTEEEVLDGLQEADWDNFIELLGFPIEVSQFDDLIVDPFGIVD